MLIDYFLTEDEALQFEKNGFLVIENTKLPQMVEDPTVVIDRLEVQYRDKRASRENGTSTSGIVMPNWTLTELKGPHERLNLLDVV